MSSPEAVPLQIQIQAALKTIGDAEAQATSQALANAIDAYVVAKLTVLAQVLQAPGAFAGTGGGPAPVVVTPAAIASYNPTT